MYINSKEPGIKKLRKLFSRKLSGTATPHGGLRYGREPLDGDALMTPKGKAYPFGGRNDRRRPTITNLDSRRLNLIRKEPMDGET